MTAPTVFKLNTRGWGEIPCIGIRMGKRVRLVATPDFEQKMGEQGKHVPAWFEREDVLAPEDFDHALEVARKEVL